MNRLAQAAGRTAMVIFCSSSLIFGWSFTPPGFRIGISRAQSTPPHPHSVDLTWKASASRVAGYKVYRSEKSGGPYTKLTLAPVTATDYTDRTVQSGHIYYYAVTAVDSKGKESVYSNQAKASIPSP